MTAAKLGQPATRVWRFGVDALPPSANHQYAPRRARSGAITGWVRTREATDEMQLFTALARAAGFRPDPDRYYVLRVRFTVPEVHTDIDNRLKTLNDAVFGHDLDHRIMQIVAEKRVLPGGRKTEVEIEDITTDEERAAAAEARAAAAHRPVARRKRPSPRTGREDA